MITADDLIEARKLVGAACRKYGVNGQVASDTCDEVGSLLMELQSEYDADSGVPWAAFWRSRIRWRVVDLLRDSTGRHDKRRSDQWNAIRTPEPLNVVHAATLADDAPPVSDMLDYDPIPDHVWDQVVSGLPRLARAVFLARLRDNREWSDIIGEFGTTAHSHFVLAKRRIREWMSESQLMDLVGYAATAAMSCR
jgi:hypothetical protein